MKTAALIDQARTRCGAPSDYRIAQLVGVSRQMVSEWRSGAKYPGTRSLFDLAELAGRNPAEVIAEIEQERELRAGRIEAAEGWRNTLQRLASVAASVAVVSICSAPAPAAAAGNPAQFASQSINLMSNRRRWSAILVNLISGATLHPA